MRSKRLLVKHMRMRTLLCLSVIIIALTSCHIETKEGSQAFMVDSTLTFNKGYKELGTNLVLNNDGTFNYDDYQYSDYIQEGEPGGWITQITGNYTTDSNKLYLIPEMLFHKELYDLKEVIIDSAKYVDRDSLKIATEYTIVKWTGNIYLLSLSQSPDLRFRMNNDFEKFADNYNSGSEPRWNGDYFALRLSRQRLEKLDKSQIPAIYRDYFLESPITVTVISITETFAYDSLFNSPISRFELNYGENRGIKEGMAFYGKESCCTIKVMKVKKDKSIGLIELCPDHQSACKVGDTLSTWNTRDYGKFVPL